MPKVVSTIVLPFSVCGYSNKTLEAINKELVGDAEVNEYNKKGKMVGKYDDHPNAAKMLEAHQRLARTTGFFGKFNVMDDGSLEFVEMK